MSGCVFFSAYLECVQAGEKAQRWWRRSGSSGDGDITQEKGSPIRFAASPLINRLCTHAHSCQSLPKLPITTVTSLSAACQPLTHTQAQGNTRRDTQTHQTRACGDWWMGGCTGLREVNVVDEYNQWAPAEKVQSTSEKSKKAERSSWVKDCFCRRSSLELTNPTDKCQTLI